MDFVKEMQRFCSLNGPSGFESPVAQAAVELMKPLVTETTIDRFGNAVGFLRCGKKDAKTILLDAHIDEIGMIVSGYDDDGFLMFTNIGGVDQRMLPDREVTILTDPPRFGVIACMPPHVLSRDEMDKSVSMKELRIDAGYTTKESAEKNIPIGTPVSFRNGTYGGFPLGKDLFCGKSMDDRASFLILVRCLEMLQSRKSELEYDVVVAATCREELGCLGGTTAGYSYCPDACVAIDVCHASTVDNRDSATVLGGGPAIGIGPNCTRWMSDRFFELGDKHRIPCQSEILPGCSGTNGWTLQISREGVPTAVLSLPERYMHTPVEVISIKDVELTAELLCEFLLNPGWGVK